MKIRRTTSQTRMAGWAMAALVFSLIMTSASPSSAQTILIDFGGTGNVTTKGASPDDPNNFWNNVNSVGTTDGGVLAGLVSTLNQPTSIGLTMIRRFNGVNENGTTVSTIFPVDATRDSLFGNTEPFGTPPLENVFPSFKLTGLAADAVYNLTFYASRTGVSDNRETGYTVEGGNTGFVTLNPANNVDALTNLNAIAPSALGEITISLAPTTNNNNGSHFTYLGILKIDVVPPQTPLTFTLEPVNQRIVQFSPVTFTSAVQGPGPYSIQWYSNSLPIPGANLFSYTIPVTTLDMNGSQFSVSVSNQAFGVLSTNATLRVISDTNAPSIVSVNTADGMLFTLIFDELLDQATSEDEFSYVINDATEVVEAVLQPDGKSVILSIAAAVTGSYTVTVNYVQDLSGNAIQETVVRGEVPRIDTQSVLFDFGGGQTTGFGPAPDDPINYWNNVTTTVGASDTGELNGIVTVAGLPTNYRLNMIRRFNGANENGTTGTAPFATDATRDSLFGNTEPFGTPAIGNVFPSFRLSGLNPNYLYTFKIYASRTGVADNRETGYTLEGANRGFGTLNVANNITNILTVPGMAPTAAGEITISLAPTPNNNNGNHFTYLGVLQMDVVADSGPVFLAPELVGGQIKVSWTGSGELESAPSIDGPWSPVLPAPASPYSETVVSTENRFYRLKKN